MQPDTHSGAQPSLPRESVEPASGWLTDRPFLVQQSKKRVSGAFGVSIVVHVVLFFGLIALLTVPAVDAIIQQAPDIVYVFTPDPRIGGGGGGSPDPPAKAEIEVPKPAVSEPTPVPKPVVDKPPQPMLPPVTTQAPMTIPGALTGLSSPIPAGGGGQGTGIGEGRGRGVGAGEGGGAGGGKYRPGSLVTNPQLTKEVKPAYTAEAMRAKIQGEVLIEAVVMPDGRIADARVVQSLDRVHGLDQKGLEAVRKWEFIPGRLRATGEPVPIIITIALTFTLR